MIRVVVGGPGLAGFPDTPHTDRYVKLLFPRPGVAYPEPFDIEAIWAALPRDQWPVMRTYTVRALDHAAGELTIDFVLPRRHRPGRPVGGRRPPGRCAAAAGSRRRLRPRPGGRLAPAGRGRERAAGHRRGLRADAGRGAGGGPAGGGRRGRAAAARGAGRAGRHLALPRPRSTRPAARLCCATGCCRPVGCTPSCTAKPGWSASVRQHLLAERGVARETLSVSGYWRRGRDEDGWRADRAAERAAEKAAEHSVARSAVAS